MLNRYDPRLGIWFNRHTLPVLQWVSGYRSETVSYQVGKITVILRRAGLFSPVARENYPSFAKSVSASLRHGSGRLCAAISACPRLGGPQSRIGTVPYFSAPKK